MFAFLSGLQPHLKISKADLSPYAFPYSKQDWNNSDDFESENYTSEGIIEPDQPCAAYGPCDNLPSGYSRPFI